MDKHSQRYFEAIIDWNRKAYGFSHGYEKVQDYNNMHTSVQKIDETLVLVIPSSAGTIRKVVYQLDAQGVVTKELGVYVKNTTLPNSDFVREIF